MDFRVGTPPRTRISPRPRKVRAVLDEAVSQAMSQARGQGPRAEAIAARCVEQTRPAWSWLASEWRRLGTLAAILLTAALLLHAMFGANGMVVYRQKRADMLTLQSEIDRLQKENDRYVEEIKSLKSDPAAIEKEAREQLHYTRPGEVVYVAPDPPQKPVSPAPAVR